jgi:hypothetical protein
MTTIMKEHRYIVRINDDEHILRVQELISGPEQWHERFRVHLYASSGYRARIVYGTTEVEAAENTAAYLDFPSTQEGG